MYNVHLCTNCGKEGQGLKIINVEYDGIAYMTNKNDNTVEGLGFSHCHDRYEILYVHNGDGKYVVEGVEYPLMPRTLMLISPFAYHSVSINPGVSYERCVIHFKDSAVVESVHRALKEITEGTQGCVFYTPESISNSIVATFDRLDAIAEMSADVGGMLSSLVLSELLVLLSVAQKTNLLPDEGEIGARVIRYLNENMDRDIPLDKLAKRFFVSKFYLCRAFKKHNGISIHGYINQKRVMYAKQLIESGETASVAAYRVGFGDYSSFYRAYVKIVGHAPTVQEKRKEN